MTIHIDVHIDASRLARILHNIEANTSKAVRDIAFRVEAQTKVNIVAMDVIDTGALLASTYTTIAGHDGYAAASSEAKAKNPDVVTNPLPRPQGNTTAHIGPSVEYAIEQELGSGSKAARPFLEQAVTTVATQLENDPSIMRQVVED